MSLLPFAIAAMTTALILYTIGVWGERLSAYLKPWHLAFFWGGLVFDTLGTELMRRIAGGAFSLSLHSATGLVALLLMAVHAVWATVTLARGREKELAAFHRLSLSVWTLWLIPYVTGVILNSGLIR